MLFSSSNEGTAKLIADAARDVRELGRLEIALAKDELRRDLGAAKATGVLGASAIVTALLGLSSLLVALGIALGPVGALMVGLLLLAVASTLAILARKRWPERPMSATLERLKVDETLLKEHHP
jgi:uncharacterized membrane protein YqjE